MITFMGALSRLLCLVLASSSLLCGYTVLTHEAIIDSVWERSLVKLLQKRFPGATAVELREAHAYAYGGCIIQDMGYYPFSSRFFSDLTHYVRSGDFVTAMIRESRDLNEYAFALGALEHYTADTYGHRIGTNQAVPLLYPELRKKYGNDVTYWDNPVAHVQTEFGFDVLQVAQGRYAPDSYRDFIGFQVSKELLERAFLDTYALEMKDVFGSVTLAVGTYRYAVRSILPGMTKVAWHLKSEQLKKEIPGITRKRFLYNLSRAGYEKEWGKGYQKAGRGTAFIAFLFRLLPSHGSLSSLRIRTPTPEVERLFMASFNATVDSYLAILAELAAGGGTVLVNQNLDAGVVTTVGKYRGTDAAYGKLLSKLAERKFAGVTPELRKAILEFYQGLRAPVGTAKAMAEFTKVKGELEALKAQ
jgi:hypothetical protein